MRVRLLRLFGVVDEAGPEMDQGAWSRWLNETMWFPQVWATDLVAWEAIDERSALASVDAAGTRVAGEFRFDSEGRVVDFVADRYRDTGSGLTLTKWSTPITRYDRFDGLELPSAGSAVWWLPDRQIEYIRLRVEGIEHHNT